MAEFVEKQHDGIHKSPIADKLPDGFALDKLGTAPAKQGRGYASAMVRFVTDQVSFRFHIARLKSTIDMYDTLCAIHRPTRWVA